MAERSEAKIEKRSFASKITQIFEFDAMLRFSIFKLRFAQTFFKFGTVDNPKVGR